MMNGWKLPALVAVCLSALLASSASAVVPGGGLVASDCYSEFQGLTPSGSSKTRADCMDGAACDSDSVKGQCTFSFNVCGYQTDPALSCTPQPITKYKGGKGLNLPGAVSTATCASASTVVVKLKKKGKKPGMKKFMLAAVTSGTPKTDKDTLVLRCLPGSGGGGGGGGGATCPNNPAGGPRELDYTITDAGHETDLDNGLSGNSHNFPVIAGSSTKLCLTECDGVTNFVCKGSGTTSPPASTTTSRPDQNPPSLNSTTLGPPLPLYASGAPVCVINRYRDALLQGTVNMKTGEVDATATPIVLLADVYSTDPLNLCPQCVGASGIGTQGTCNIGPNAGKACTVDGTVPTLIASQPVRVYQLSRSCPPGGEAGSFDATLTITLGLTTGTSSRTGRCPGQALDDQCGAQGGSGTCNAQCQNVIDNKGGINQWCCGDGKTPCFPTAPTSGEPNHAIVRTGSPVAPTPGAGGKLVATNAKLAAVFCEASTNRTVVDTVAGLPGPGALIFNGTEEWLPNQ